MSEELRAAVRFYEVRSSQIRKAIGRQKLKILWLSLFEFFGVFRGQKTS